MNRQGLIFIVLCFIINFFSLAPVQGQNPFIPKYDAVKRSERCFTVTWEANNQFGAVWWADKVDFSSDTLFNFVVYMGDRDGNGADGLAFVMHQDPRDTITDPSKQVIIGGAGTWDLQAATGDDGGGLGYAMHQSRVGPNTIPGPHGPGDDPENHKIQKSVAVEMDTWNNTDVPDGKNGSDANGVNQVVSPFYGWDHTSVVYNGDIYGQQQVITDAVGNTGRILPLKPAYAFGSANNPDGSPHHNIEDDRCYLFQIRWEVNPDGTQNLQLWADVYNGTTNTDGLQMIMTHTDDMINNVFGGNPTMRFGFTGSTGGSINEQTICLLGENLKPFAQDDYASIPMNTQAIIDVESNDNDPDGDELHVPIIIEPAKHGQAVIFDSLDINYMRYLPNTNYVGLDTIGYVTCDVNSTKCYAKCDTAHVYINVGCVPFDINVNATAANTVCSTTVPANGVAEVGISGSAISGTLWYEGFEDLNDGAIVDNGTSSWSFTTSGNCSNSRVVAVENKRFRAKQTGCEIIFETENINIAGVSDVSVNVDLSAAGDMESDDFLNVYYKLDGGAEIPFTNGLHQDNFGSDLASIKNLNGSTLKIVIHAKNSGGDENYYWDNIKVTAIGAGTPNVTFNWYQGNAVTGPIIYTGTINNTLYHGNYTVQAIDNNTGCPSNPFTVTVDSAGYKLKGGFIEQLSPFTNCKLPYDGALGSGIYDGTDTVTVGYTFNWYFQEDPKIPSFLQRTGAVAQNLESREYTVVITEIATGCDTTLNAEVPNAVTIPTVIATKIADVTSCTNPDSGIGAASVGGVTNGYQFEWYAGPAIGSGPPDFTGYNINTFPVGIYTVQAIDSVTSCPSDPATITIQDVTLVPLLDVQIISNQTSCDPLAPTGELSGTVDVSGIPTISGYTFNWYKGPNDIIPARPGYSGGPTVDGLEAGNYRLVVIEDATNCTSFLDTLVLENIVIPPAITALATDVTSCNAPNGTITVTVAAGENPADYLFEVYKGNGVITDSLISSSNSPLIQNLPVGNFTVVGKNIITKCATDPIPATINDATALPAATFITVNQSSCDPNNPSGQVTANMGFAAITDFTFAWFENDLTGAPIASSSINGEIISGLDSGDYAVQITNNTTQCTNVYYPSVNIAIVLPVEIVSSSPSSNCGITANGQLIATVDGGLTEVDGYTFNWESVATGLNLPATTATVTGVAPGDYILTVVNDATSCSSNPAPVTVDDNTVTPIPTLVVTNNSSCDISNPNGSIEVTVTNESPAYNLTNYSYGWYDNTTGNPVVNIGGPNGEIANTLSAGTYELQLQNTTTSCTNSVLSQIIDINIKPIIDAVTPDPAENCIEPYNSGAVVNTVNGGSPIPVGYTFEWSNLDNGSLLISGTGSSILDYDLTDETLPPGNYQVIAYNEFNCPSDPLTFEILDNSVAPTFVLQENDNISCDPANPVGILMASRTIGSTFTIGSYEWFLNNASGIPFDTTVPNDSIHFDLAAGTYAVRITDAANGCTSVEFATIQDAPASIPVIQNISNIGLTSCVMPPNGELAYQVAPFENIPPLNLTPRTYTFYLNGSASYNQTTAGTNSVNFTTLADGDWDAYVVDNFTNCQSDPITSTLSSAPEIMITSDAIQLPTSCLGNDGILKIYAETPTNDSISGGAGFIFNWFLGVDGSKGAVVSSTSPNNFWSSASNLVSDYYFITIEDRVTGCVKDTSVFLPSISLPLINIASVTPSDRCDPFGNGGVSVTLSGFPLGYGYPDYDLRLYKGTTFDPDNLATNLAQIIAAPAGGPVVFASTLAPGIYTIVAAENFGTCFSDPIQVIIDLNFSFPSFVFDITPDKSCSGATDGTGKLEVLNTNPAIPLGNFNFEWFIGSTLEETGAVTPATMFANNYNLVAEITANIPGQGCVGDSLINLPKILDKINVVTAASPNQNCAPFYDGQIQITDITENSLSIGALPGDYVNFTLFDKNLVSLSSNNTAIPWNSLSPDSYFVQAQNDITKCYSNIKKVIINNLSQNPLIAITLNSPDYACDPLLANGELVATASGSNNIAEYDFNWYRGTTSGSFLVNNPIASNLSANNSSQLYTIEVIDKLGPNEGCKSTKPYTLSHQTTNVYLLNQEIDVTDQNQCLPNGSILVNTIFEFDPYTNSTNTENNPYASYSARLLESNLNPSPSSYGTFNLVTGYFDNGSGNSTVIPAGSYYIQAKNNATACSYGPLTQVIVKDVSKKPIVTATLSNPDYACTGGASTGVLSPTVLGGSDNDLFNNFTINWYLKGTLTSPLTDNGGGTYADRAIDLTAGFYTIEVTDNVGVDQNCITRRDYLVPSSRHAIAITASGTDQTICIPDGTIQINNIAVDGGPNVVNPHLTWIAQLLNQNKKQIIPIPTESGFASDMPYSNIAAGTYFVRTQDNSTKCYSSPYQVIIKDISTDPVPMVVVTTPQYSLNPNPLSWTGELQASVNETDGSIDTYNLNWYKGIGTSTSLNETLLNVDSLDIGLYTFVAKNVNTGCESSYYKYLPFEYLEPTFNTLVSPKTICAPNNGAIEVTDIALEGIFDNLSDYTFNWHHDTYSNGDIPDAIIPGDDALTIYNNINEGAYYIIAREDWWWLESYPVKVVVIDSTTNPIITFDATSYSSLTSCDASIFADGALGVEVYEDNTNPYLNPPFDYSYSWYKGNNADPANILAGETSNQITGLPSGNYTVLVVNLANNCQSDKTYTIEDLSKTPIVIASQTPNTNCPIEIANGITSANVINTINSYNYNWYVGSEAAYNPDHIGATWDGRPVGFYTVVAVDKNLATCISEPVVIKVEDATKKPLVVINELSPVTNCDPERPNGVLSAVTKNGVGGHTFEWFLNDKPYTTGPIASNLGLMDYTLIVTNNVTQCKTTMVSGPTKLLSLVPAPDVDILNERTSCLEPDGSATASISGNVTDYIFNYYNKYSGEELSNLFVDYVIYDLDTSTYLVTAEDRTSGCISEPTEFAVSNETYFPEIDIIVNPSSCQEPSGAADVVITDLTRDFKVTWYGENGFEENLKELVYIPAGKYTVVVEGTDGCTTSAETEVKEDVIIYNGVSANNDGMNDYFQIICLEYFPENNVKIFNRAGMLVYEQNFYDMTDPAKRFDGISNRGTSVTGKDLPIGTYFYVVNKNDGSKAKVGYLELNR